MTDAEKELRRLAEECIRRGTPGAWPADLRALHVAMPPAAVLSLLDRIDQLERRVASLVSQQVDAIEAEEEAGTVYPRSNSEETP